MEDDYHDIGKHCPEVGAFVISLDFELYWGVRDLYVLGDREKQRILAARAVVPRILDLFSKYSVHATWATVGALFCESREQYRFYAPKLPSANDGSVVRCEEKLGHTEDDDPYHFAPGLIKTISTYDGQEIGCHSFSHFSALESGQTGDQFGADLLSSVRIARDSGITLRSYVFPRNQVNQDCLPALREQGFSCYRGNNIGYLWNACSFDNQQKWYKRIGRLADNYLNLYGPQVREWPERSGLADVGSSRYLRPFSPVLRQFENLRRLRIVRAMHAAAAAKKLFHLWFHPEDFAGYPEENLAFLTQILEQFRQTQDRYGMQSLSMHETTTAVTAPEDFSHVNSLPLR